MNGGSWEEKYIAVEAGLEQYRGRKDNLLVIAPHPDDDVLGAGGSMAEASAGGRGVFSLYITDGRGSPRIDHSISDEKMAGRREGEALAALKAVGGAGGFFLRRRSAELRGAGGAEALKEMTGILQSIAPNTIYLPAPYERHRTHQICTRLAVDALRQSGVKAALLGYSLWGCFWGEKPRVTVDISASIRKKVEAVLAHSTQTAYKGYQQGILGKNNYEAIFQESQEVEVASFVETFLIMTELLERKDLSLENFVREDMEAFLRAYL